MVKMGLESTILEVERGLAWPGTQLYRIVVPTDELKKYGLQKKRSSEVTHYLIWVLAIGEMGQQPSFFYGHEMIEAAKKAHKAKTGVANGS